MKALKIIALFLGCSLAWLWIDQCGAYLRVGETLPFCIDCSGMATFMRIVLLGIAMYGFYRIIQSRPDDTELLDPDTPPGRTYLIHWHRIALLLALLTYPLWLSWIDDNTIIPGPDALWLTRNSCRYAGVKGTLLWGVELSFVVITFRILHRN
ncbi:MAG: hypothetical protein IIB00_07005 [candidate division Zixibacteria bacterium]|nr:hypothetical protein [candidate division Zixibacteria bacterium]